MCLLIFLITSGPAAAVGRIWSYLCHHHHARPHGRKGKPPETGRQLPARDHHALQGGAQSQVAGFPRAAGDRQQGSPGQPAVPVRDLADRERAHV